MDEILQRLDAQDKKLADIFVSVEKTRRYFLWTLIMGVLLTVLPLLGMAFILPSLFSPLSLPAGL